MRLSSTIRSVLYLDERQIQIPEDAFVLYLFEVTELFRCKLKFSWNLEGEERGYSLNIYPML